MHQILDPLLRPLARLAIARGWQFAPIAERLRHAVLRAAQRAAGAGATDSRLSVMTGLQRRDIARLRAAAATAPADAAGGGPVSPLSRLVATWLADPAYGGRPLPRRGVGSFDALAASVLRDVHPRTFLDQLVAAGTVRDDGDGVTLLHPAYRPLAGSDDQLVYLAHNVGDHLAASVDNVADSPRHFERAVHYNGLSVAAVAELDALWRLRQDAALIEVNARAAALQATAPGELRIRAGAYFYQATESDEAAT